MLSLLKTFSFYEQICGVPQGYIFEPLYYRSFLIHEWDFKIHLNCIKICKSTVIYFVVKFSNSGHLFDPCSAIWGQNRHSHLPCIQRPVLLHAYHRSYDRRWLSGQIQVSLAMCIKNEYKTLGPCLRCKFCCSIKNRQTQQIDVVRSKVTLFFWQCI